MARQEDAENRANMHISDGGVQGHISAPLELLDYVGLPPEPVQGREGQPDNQGEPREGVHWVSETDEHAVS